MKPTLCWSNTGRVGLIDEGSLIDTLTKQTPSRALPWMSFTEELSHARTTPLLRL